MVGVLDVVTTLLHSLSIMDWCASLLFHLLLYINQREGQSNSSYNSFLPRRKTRDDLSPQDFLYVYVYNIYGILNIKTKNYT